MELTEIEREAQKEVEERMEEMFNKCWTSFGVCHQIKDEETIDLDEAEYEILE